MVENVLCIFGSAVWAYWRCSMVITSISWHIAPCKPEKSLWIPELQTDSAPPSGRLGAWSLKVLNMITMRDLLESWRVARNFSPGSLAPSITQQSHGKCGVQYVFPQCGNKGDQRWSKQIWMAGFLCFDHLNGIHHFWMAKVKSRFIPCLCLQLP